MNENGSERKANTAGMIDFHDGDGEETFSPSALDGREMCNSGVLSCQF